MLYVVETDNRGRVTAIVECEDGIDQAIDIIASGLTGPEGDPGVAIDVVMARWNDATRNADLFGGSPHAAFYANRGERTPRYGLAVA